MVVDLTYLQHATDGDKELIAQLVDLFREQIVEFSTEMNESIAGNEAERLRRVAHKAKGSISALGMTAVRALLQEIEEECTGKASIRDVTEMRKKVDIFVSNCKQAEVELLDYLKVG